MPATPGAMCGTSAPTAKNFVATAIPICPSASSFAMIDQVIPINPSASGCVALHAPRIGRGTAAVAEARGRGQPSFGPVGADFDNVTASLQFVDGRLRHPVLEHQHAGTCGAWPEGDGKMLGMPG